MGKIVSVKSYLPNTVIRRTGSGMTQPGLLKMENMCLTQRKEAGFRSV